MKKFLSSIFACFYFFIPSVSRASHAAGVELRYEHLTGNDYRFHFILFRDCLGINANNQYTIHGKSECGGSVSLTVMLDSTINVSQTCNTITDMCVNQASPYMGIEANYYHGDITISAPCSLWTFALDPIICNRNVAINNLTPNGGVYCTYIETKLNNADFPNNSSPVFSALPLFHLCNQTQYLHLYAFDYDGDSLAYEMYTPHSDSDTDVVYINGLSAFQPVTYALPADSTLFDPLTGDIRFKADGAQVTVVGVRVNEFRNGIFVGSEERDIELVFSNCTSHSPTATGINGMFSFTSHICADSLLNFYINTVDVDGDSVRSFWQNNIPGSTVNLTGVNNEIVSFAWQPATSDISPVPYTFTLYVTDSTCPYVYYNSYQYKIYVDSCFATTGIDGGEHAFAFNAFYSSLDQSIVYSFESRESQAGSISLVDLQGRILWSEEMKSSRVANGKIPASMLSHGMYLLKLKSVNGSSQSLKVLKN